MSEVVKMSDYRPHLQGPARCLNCKYEWQAVASVGTTELDCPECRTAKGYFVWMAVPDTALQCNCGEWMFHVNREGALCAHCGTLITFEELADA
jgi:hypothetical protein